MQEKIKVNLSYNTYNLLLKDMDDFSYFVKNNKPNANLFYNTIIKNMYELKKSESDEFRDFLYNTLREKIKDINTINKIIDETEYQNNKIFKDTTNRSFGYYISFRPSKKFESIYDEIENLELKNSSISNYYRNLFNAYANLSQDEREKIVFKDTYDLINSAINNKKYLILNNGKKIMPYKMVRTNDELYNYLIGATNINKFYVVSLHLYKCCNAIKSKESFEFSKEQLEALNKNLEFGPQQIEMKNVISKVKLSEKGLKMFKKYYLNRPTPIEINDDLYIFNCSAETVFTYFSRYGKEALILEPSFLKVRLKNYYKNAFNKYNE